MKKKKVNPRKRLATKADVEKAKKEAMNQSVICAWAIMFSVMRDKFGWNTEQLQALWDHVESLSDSIAKGYIKTEDLIRVLEEEDGIVLE